jgi:hypothetical protein
MHMKGVGRPGSGYKPVGVGGAGGSPARGEEGGPGVRKAIPGSSMLSAASLKRHGESRGVLNICALYFWPL